MTGCQRHKGVQKNKIGRKKLSVRTPPPPISGAKIHPKIYETSHFAGCLSSLIHGFCAFSQAALDTCLDSPFFCQPLSSRVCTSRFTRPRVWGGRPLYVGGESSPLKIKGAGADGELHSLPILPSSAGRGPVVDGPSATLPSGRVCSTSL